MNNGGGIGGGGETSGSFRLGVDEIQRFLPHRHPFLLVDRILDIRTPGNDWSDFAPEKTMGVRVTALKAVSFNEPYFQGHFPGYAILPGVLVTEMMAQAASFSTYPFLMKELDQVSKKFQCILVGVDGARFRKPIVPGDSIRVESEVVKRRGMLWGFRCEAWVDGHRVAEAEILANLVVKGEGARS